jgi:DNA-binding SARP family transcriptional activator
MRPQADGSTTQRASLQLLGWWHLTRGGRPLHLGGREQRLTALLALRGRRPRVLVAATLWPDTLEDRARASLRTAIKRTQEHAPGLLAADRSTIGLSGDVRVDVNELMRAMRGAPARQHKNPAALLSLLESADLLPGWYDDWVLYEREKLEQTKVRTLETVATTAYERDDLVTALHAAQAASRMEPLLDAMRSIVIRARLGLGDVSGAAQELRRYRRFLAQELGIEPPAELAALFEGLRSADGLGADAPGARRRPRTARNGTRLDLSGP